MPRRSSSIPDNVEKIIASSTYGKPESVGVLMARMAGAPIRREVTECDAVSAYPPEMTIHRRSTHIPENAGRKRKTTRIDESVVPMRIGSRRTDDYLCGMLPKHTHPTPDWLIHPENYRCVCGRYCSSSFLVNGLCGYCRGQF
jgi:hypothetical protein